MFCCQLSAIHDGEMIMSMLQGVGFVLHLSNKLLLSLYKVRLHLTAVVSIHSAAQLFCLLLKCLVFQNTYLLSIFLSIIY